MRRVRFVVLFIVFSFASWFIAQLISLLNAPSNVALFGWLAVTVLMLCVHWACSFVNEVVESIA